MQRSLRRSRNIGATRLKKASGTSLDKGVELDALAKIAETDEELADDLVERAAAGETVSARAVKRLGWEKVDCRVMVGFDKLHAEIAEIDENLIRNNPDAAEHALLTARRAELFAALEALKQAAEPDNLSQVGTGSKKPGPPREAGSSRDQSAKTGESKSRVARSMSRAEKIGTERLEKVKGTSLASGVELDALAKLPAPEQDALVEKAVAGEKVSARTAHVTTQADATYEALEAFRDWREKYGTLPALTGRSQALNAIEDLLEDAGAGRPPSASAGRVPGVPPCFSH